MAANAERWPSLPLEAWRGTYAAMHLWLQMAGKVRLALSPWQNHSWHVTLYPTATGLTTSPIPHDGRAFDIVFDFIEHRLDIRASDGRSTGFALGPGSVAGFYRRFRARTTPITQTASGAS
jgi:hypothetical protein